jgi:hypothetical protein
MAKSPVSAFRRQTGPRAMTSLVRGRNFDWKEGLGIKICESQADKMKQGQLNGKNHMSQPPEGKFGWNKECSHRVGCCVNEFGRFVNKGCGG